MTQSLDQHFIRFADLLEKNPTYAPMRHHQPPMWDLTRVKGGVPAELRGVISVAHIPTINFGPKDVDAAVPEGTPLVEIDSNGAFVAAASSARFAHCALTHTGPLELPEKGQLPGGYMLMDAHPWGMGVPGSPLGNGRPKLTTEGRVWVPHTVGQMLRDLTYGASWTPGGHWPDCTVYDSWTADVVPFELWAGVVRDTRAAAKIGGDKATGERIKVAYSQAVQMWSTPPDPKGTPVEKREKKNKAYRPDWYAALRGQHFANMWRRAYTAAVVHRMPPIRVWDTDRMIFAEHHLLQLLGANKSPVRLDETGIQLGTFKRLSRWYAGIEV
ncbi:hypothetical protein ACIRD9_42480 [Streptomyces violaceus]|uniref:hypothetical protein n=1 Tax=Streptomyces violaceus TaxID=1936 RepID=UPI0038202B45